MVADLGNQGQSKVGVYYSNCNSNHHMHRTKVMSYLWHDVELVGFTYLDTLEKVGFKSR